MYPDRLPELSADDLVNVERAGLHSDILLHPQLAAH